MVSGNVLHIYWTGNVIQIYQARLKSKIYKSRIFEISICLCVSWEGGVGGVEGTTLKYHLLEKTTNIAYWGLWINHFVPETQPSFNL